MSAKLRLPKQVRVTSRVTYDVIFDESISPDYGHCICHDKEIIINPKKNKSKVALIKTFIHELLHALDYETEDKQNGWEKNKTNLKHSDVYALERSIYKLLVLNEWI